MSASVASACHAVAANVAAARSARGRASVRRGGDAVCGARATRVIAPRGNARLGVVMNSMDELDAEGESPERSFGRGAASSTHAPLPTFSFSLSFLAFELWRVDGDPRRVTGARRCRIARAPRRISRHSNPIQRHRASPALTATRADR